MINHDKSPPILEEVLVRLDNIFRRSSTEEPPRPGPHSHPEHYDPYDPQSREFCTIPEDISKTEPHYQLQTCTTLDTRLDNRTDVDILKQTCPYGTTGRPGSCQPIVMDRTHQYEYPKLV